MKDHISKHDLIIAEYIGHDLIFHQTITSNEAHLIGVIKKILTYCLEEIMNFIIIIAAKRNSNGQDQKQEVLKMDDIQQIYQKVVNVFSHQLHLLSIKIHRNNVLKVLQLIFCFLLFNHFQVVSVPNFKQCRDEFLLELVIILIIVKRQLLLLLLLLLLLPKY